MLHVRGVRDNSGTLISAYNVGTINTITTEGINTERGDKQGLLFVLAGGSIASVTRQISIDNSNWYNVYDMSNSNVSTLVTAISNSRYIILGDTNSANVIAPYTRFNFVGTGTIATLTLYYIQQEK